MHISKVSKSFNEEVSFLFNDDSKKCKVVYLKGHQSYNQVEHLNVVNHIHSIIKNKLAQYRGVATKYINRYTALFVCMRGFMEMDRKR